MNYGVRKSTDRSTRNSDAETYHYFLLFVIWAMTFGAVEGKICRFHSKTRSRKWFDTSTHAM